MASPPTAHDNTTADDPRPRSDLLTIIRFRFGDPIHVYKIKAIDGVVANEETGVRFSSEVTVIR